MISDRAKRLVEALQSWRDLDSAYAIAQRFLDLEAADAVWAYTHGPGWEGSALSPLAEKIAQTRGQNGETE